MARFSLSGRPVSRNFDVLGEILFVRVMAFVRRLLHEYLEKAQTGRPRLLQVGVGENSAVPEREQNRGSNHRAAWRPLQTFRGFYYPAQHSEQNRVAAQSLGA